MSLDEWKKMEIVGEAGAGLVKVVYNGLGEPVRVEIDDLIFKETDKQLISDLFCAAARQAVEKFGEMVIQSQRSPVTDLLSVLGGEKNK